MNTTRPKIGQLMTVRGQQCRIIKIRPLGTVDVETLDGERAYRVSGLPFFDEKLRDWDDTAKNWEDV